MRCRHDEPAGRVTRGARSRPVRLRALRGVWRQEGHILNSEGLRAQRPHGSDPIVHRFVRGTRRDRLRSGRRRRSKATLRRTPAEVNVMTLIAVCRDGRSLPSRYARVLDRAHVRTKRHRQERSVPACRRTFRNSADDSLSHPGGFLGPESPRGQERCSCAYLGGREGVWMTPLDSHGHAHAGLPRLDGVLSDDRDGYAGDRHPRRGGEQPRERRGHPLPRDSAPAEEDVTGQNRPSGRRRTSPGN